MEMIKTEELKELIKNGDEETINKKAKEISDKIYFKTYIPLQEYAQMITDMVETVFNGGVYNVYLYEFAFDYNFYKYCSNLDCTDIDTIFKLCRLIEYFNHCKNFNTLYSKARTDYEKAVEFRKQLICSSSSWESVGDLVTELLTKLNTSVDKINKSDISIKDLVTAFKNMPNSEEVAKSVLEIEKEKLNKDTGNKVKDFPKNETKQ